MSPEQAFLVVDLTERPKLTLTIHGRRFEGILDTGADRSIISSHWWPKGWPLVKTDHALQGLGYAQSPDVSTQLLPWRSEEGKEGTFTPYVLPLPVNLWGRDVLVAMGMVLTTDYSLKAQQMMHKMGYHPGEGLGRKSNGITTPLQVEGQTDRKGLGF
ncbi:endogenous retrovirus group K member 7 Pro protein-like [Sorex araneus]|uniref:endogenous retrovirus group K member 7 Pro protein-like n=1 Tax=Sorex araneus TaxID=42254 RepID=UPI00243391E0|nr:endogenous retrovirus group K member 7 Pro protein-like [Sorex araneus]